MAMGRVLVHALALAGVAAVAVAFGRWLRDPQLGGSLLLLALAAICALALRRLYGPGGLVGPEPAPAREPPARPDTADDPAAATGPANGVAAATGPPPVDLNSASEAELRTLPGVGAVLAGRIAAARPFRSVDDLAAVPGFNAARLRALAGRVRV